jgi:hypothetical protein
MQRMSRTSLMLFFVALGSLALAGCGSKGATTKGHVLQSGQPYKFADGEQMSITFNSTAGGESASADVDKDGSFTVPGPGLPSGTYKASVVSSMVGPDVPANWKYKDRLNGAFSGPNSPLQVEVGTERSLSLVVDLGLKTVAKQ